jgi:hypothetical protein
VSRGILVIVFSVIWILGNIGQYLHCDVCLGKYWLIFVVLCVSKGILVIICSAMWVRGNMGHYDQKEEEEEEEEIEE